MQMRGDLQWDCYSSSKFLFASQCPCRFLKIENLNVWKAYICNYVCLLSPYLWGCGTLHSWEENSERWDIKNPCARWKVSSDHNLSWAALQTGRDNEHGLWLTISERWIITWHLWIQNNFQEVSGSTQTTAVQYINSTHLAFILISCV